MGAHRILVVDDNVSNLRLFTFLLATENYEVLTACDAEEALALLGSSLPDLILLDLQLPGMDGLTLARKLKSDAQTRHIPIIAVTAHAMKGDEEKALQAGVDGYLSKPINKSSFRAAVAAALSDK